MMDDQTAIEKIQNGEREWFRHLVESYQRQAVAHAFAILGNRSDAEDAAQEAFIDAFRGLGRFDNSKRFYPWFYVLLRHRCYKMTKQRRAGENLEDLEIVAPADDLPREERIALDRALLELPVEDREIICLKYLDGLSYDEIAARLEIPRGTVMSRLFYARKQMQAKLSRKYA
jgi:RNA polymerase sigma-70 factor, ECF subfamily